jgi:hypothetical protein
VFGASSLDRRVLLAAKKVVAPADHSFDSRELPARICSDEFHANDGSSVSMDVPVAQSNSGPPSSSGRADAEKAARAMGSIANVASAAKEFLRPS